MNTNLRLLLVLLFLAHPTIGCSEETRLDDHTLEVLIIPEPANLERLPGAFVIDAETSMMTAGQGAAAARAGALLAEALRTATGHPLLHNSEGGKTIAVRVAEGATELGEEGYRLDVTPNRILLDAPPAGLFRGIQTIRQLLQGNRIPAVRIKDVPRFAWRGLHLDVGRHWFPVEDVKRYIDALAFFKMNTLHWHLTEDQGWRIEIKRYPKLTSVGSKRPESPRVGARNEGDGTPYGGFYTQEEIREVVRYAADRFITIVPEIELPGHAQAAIAAYPELGNTGEQLEVRTRWGVSRHVYNVEDSTFEFLENVLDEVLELFPGEFIHIGGDECPKEEWKASPAAQARMEAEGLENEHELQSWFIRRIERYLDEKGRRLIGWDEIQEGGLAPGAAMMVWRSWQYGVEAVKAGHDIVMSPNSHCYFDHYQGPAAEEPEAIGGFLPLEKVYAFEPIPPELTAEEAKHVLGAQGNLWTEYMHTMDHVLYMAYPRGAALAEVLWSPRELRDYDDFLKRWARISLLLDEQGVNHRLMPPVARVTAHISPEASEVVFEPAPDGHLIRYTVDGSVPTAESKVYDGPIRIEETAVVTAARFTPGGRQSGSVSVDVVRAAPVQLEGLEPGLWIDCHPGAFRKVPEFDGREPAWTEKVDGVQLTGREPEDNFALRFTGFLMVDEAATFQFELGSDDGSVFRIAGARVVSLDGPHGFLERRERVHLEKGVYPVEIGFFELGGAERLEFEMDGPGKLMRRKAR